MMNKKCLYCYAALVKSDPADFHERCSLKFFGRRTPPILDYALDQMTELAKNVVERSVAVPGVQPKLSLTIVGDSLKNGRAGRLTIVGALGGRYVLKPPFPDYPEMPQNEHTTMLMAREAFGIQTVPCSLIRLKSGELAYITRRIDRTAEGEKLHMLDMFQITEAADKYRSSMERVGKAIAAWSDNTLLDQSYFFELAVFCFLTGNSDMHLKNFSLINNTGSWGLAPAYDLLNVVLVNPADDEELALTLEGKKKKLKKEHFIRLAEGLGLNYKQISNTFARFIKHRHLADEWIDRSFLSDEFKEGYRGVMRERWGMLG